MRLPSVDLLTDRLQIERSDAIKVRQLLLAGSTQEHRSGSVLRRVSNVLGRTGLNGFHGVEVCRGKNGRWFEYLNTGSTYAETLIYCSWTETYRISSVGTLIESRTVGPWFSE